MSLEPEFPDDLGRRVTMWRERAGMTRAQLADRAGISAGYLEYVETRPTSRPSMGTVMRLAAVLNTSALELLGGNAYRVAGAVPANRETHLVTLEPDRSWTLLGRSGIGRIVFDSPQGPVALPVNYAVSDRDVFFRTSEDAAIARIDVDAPVSFEADHIDDAMSAGWSVIVHGTCQHFDPECKPDGAADVQVQPWAGGRRDHWIRLRARSIEGRAIETAS